MRSNRTLPMLLVSLLFIGGIAHAQTVVELRSARQNAEDLVDEKKSDHDDATENLNTQIAIFVRLHGHLAKTALNARPPRRTRALIMEFTRIVTTIMNTNHLTSEMRQRLTVIEIQRDKCDEIWADVVLAQTAYEDAVDAYNDAVSPEERVPTDSMPDPAPVSNLYLCPGPCSTPFTTQVLATTSHQVFCDKAPHKT